MISGDDIEIGEGRLDDTTKKLTSSDVGSLVSVFRILCGPLELTKKYNFRETLMAVSDLDNTEQVAAKLAGTLSRIIDEDFGVDTLTTALLSNDYDQRRIFALFAFSLLWPIPIELTSIEAYELFVRSYQGRRISHNFRTPRVL